MRWTCRCFRQIYVDYPNMKADAAINTRFRLNSRDAILKSNIQGDQTAKLSSSIDKLTYVDAVTGIGGWSDNSDTVSVCRQILKDESGIEIPDSSLVVRSLGWYLVILVPVNYLVFRLMGRLEYAWLTVPVIALGGAIWVAREARLDIGFARSQMELAVLEMPENYSRGHLTRVVAIYNSLSDRYEIQFESLDGAAAPVADFVDESEDDNSVFKVSFEAGPALSGLTVDSNKAKMVHTEEMIDIGGGFRRQGDNLINNSQYELLDTYVVENDGSGGTRIALVGACPPGSSTALRFKTMKAPAVSDELPMQTARLIRRLAAPAATPRGSSRMVGRIDQSLPGMAITPASNQSTAQTIVLAHLGYRDLPEPRPDTNLLSQFKKAQRATLGTADDGNDSDQQ